MTHHMIVKTQAVVLSLSKGQVV